MASVHDPGAPPPRAAEPLRYGSADGRWVLLATIGGSSIAFLDSTVVNVALPSLGNDLGADVAGLQWVLNGYLLALSSLILLAGSLGDRYGRRRIFVIGVVWFAFASLLCAFAQSIVQLVVARVLQGVGGALLTPGSLAIINASFVQSDRGRAIGAWSGLTSIASAVGPFLGGWLIDTVGWRAVFLINLPIAAAVAAVALRFVPESSDPDAVRRLDTPGAFTGAVGLGAVTFALIESGERGASALVITAGVIGVLALAAFVLIERRSTSPMLPLTIFSARQFTWTNVVTFAVYAGLGTVSFLLVVQLQVSLGYSAMLAGLATLPITGLLLVLSSRAGALAQQIGPRVPMTVGPLTAALGIALMVRVVPGAGYVAAVLPAVVVFGVGLGLTVAPLTTTVLAAADDRHSGVASGVNNAVARVAQLLAVAVLPPLVGLVGDAYAEPALFTAGFRAAMLLAAGLVGLGGVVAALTISSRLQGETSEPEPVGVHCDLCGPPLRSDDR